MALAVHCDREECDTWAYTAFDFFTVSAGPDYTKHYCCRWCMIVEESKDAEPTEVVK